MNFFILSPRIKKIFSSPKNRKFSKKQETSIKSQPQKTIDITKTQVTSKAKLIVTFTCIIVTLIVVAILGYKTNLNAKEYALNNPSKIHQSELLDQLRTQTTDNQNIDPLAINTDLEIAAYNQKILNCKEHFKNKSTEAFTICEALTKEENSPAEIDYIIGKIYLEGIGVAKSFDRALIWFNKASKKGNPEAKKDLGIVSIQTYLDNKVIGTFETGKKLLEEAANAGNIEARFTLIEIKKNPLFKEVIQINEIDAFNELKDFVTQNENYIPAINELAEMYIIGKGTTKNVLAGYKLLQKSANLHSSKAYKILSLLEEANPDVLNYQLSYVHQYFYTHCKNTSSNMIRLNKLERYFSPEELNKLKQFAKEKLPQNCND